MIDSQEHQRSHLSLITDVESCQVVRNKWCLSVKIQIIKEQTILLQLFLLTHRKFEPKPVLAMDLWCQHFIGPHTHSVPRQVNSITSYRLLLVITGLLSNDTCTYNASIYS